MDSLSGNNPEMCASIRATGGNNPENCRYLESQPENRWQGMIKSPLCVAGQSMQGK